MYLLVLVSSCSFLSNCNYLLTVAYFEHLIFFHPIFSLIENHTCLGTLKGGRADWLVEKCTVRFNNILRFYLVRLTVSICYVFFFLILV